MRDFVRTLTTSGVIRTTKLLPPLSQNNIPVNHNKFLVVTQAKVDGTLTDLLLTGSANLTR